MKTTWMLIIVATVLAARGEEILATYDWSARAAAGHPLPGVLTSSKDLLILNTNPAGLRVELLRIEVPAITAQTYALRGKIRYEGVEGKGFLEMWSVFPPATVEGRESRYFSRTLENSGAMGTISGQSDWRPLLLPFHITEPGDAPVRLEVNLVLPGPGQVTLGALQLAQFATGAWGARAEGAWWSEATGGIIGGVCGALVGCLGSLTGWLASQRKARGFVFATLSAGIIFGAGMAILGAVALGRGQPFAVWFVGVLLGAITLAILPGRWVAFRRLYQESELRRMVAADAVR